MKKFVLYTNPNNVSNYAYCVVDSRAVNAVLKDAKEYPGSYSILYRGKGTDDKIEEIKDQFRSYKFV